MEASIISISEQAPDPNFRLVEGAELFTGVNNVPMLYLSKQSKYIRLSPLGADIIAMFNTHQVLTNSDIVQALLALYPDKQLEVNQKVPAFLTQLQKSGVIFSPEILMTEKSLSNQSFGIRYLLHLLTIFFLFLQNRPILRIALWKPQKPIAENILSKLRGSQLNISLKILLGIWFLVATVGALFTAVRQGMFFNNEIVIWPLVICVYLLHMFLHEMCHLLLISYYKARVRSFGVALLYYILPSFYVDRTDSYRLTSARQHVYISLAGPAFDISAAALSALLVITTSGWLKASFHVLLIVQSVTFIVNINPLVPSDGYRALEAGLKIINFRQRAFQLLFCLFTRRTLPPHLATQTIKERSSYILYGITAFAWTTFLIVYISLWYITNGSSLVWGWLSHLAGH